MTLFLDILANILKFGFLFVVALAAIAYFKNR